MKNPSFKERVVVITGASSGIGGELALQLAEQGAWIALGDRDAENLDGTGALCRELGGKVLTVLADVTEKAQCAHLIEQTISEYSRIDTLINNAGITMLARFDETRDLESIEKVMQVNFFGSVYCTHYALPFLKKSKGRIVAISSLAGKTGLPKRSGYAASKHAMVGFFDTLRMELADDGVSVTLVYPGFVATELRKEAVGPDGNPVETSPVCESEAMTVDACVRLILRAANLRKRELIMGLRGKVGVWLKLVAPCLVDRMAIRASEKGL